MWTISIQSFFRAAGYNFFVTFFPSFLEYVYGISRKDAGMYTTGPLLGVITGGLIGGWLVDSLFRRTGNKRISRSAVAVGTLGFTSLLTFASTWTTTAEGLVAVISIGALFSGMAGPSAWTATMDMSGKHTAVIVGIANMAGCISGFVATPLLGRLIKEIKNTNGNWNLVIYLHVAYYLAAAICWVFIRPEKLIVPSSDGPKPA
jgi:MFS family permease